MTPSTSLPSHGSLPLPKGDLWKQRSVLHPAGHPYGSSPDSVEPSVRASARTSLGYIGIAIVQTLRGHDVRFFVLRRK